MRFGEDRRPPGRPGFLARRAVLGAGGVPVVQYRLAPSEAQGGPEAYGLLEREVAASVALERRYGAEKFVGVLTRVVGFDLSAAEPFVLYRPPIGRPLTEWAGRLDADDQERITGQLAMAVRLMAGLGIVHRAITPENVRWDGTRARLCEPYAALRAGEQRAPYGAAPWAPPEQRAGRGAVDPRDDLWSVAALAYHLLSGRTDRGDGPPADLGDYRRLAALRHSGLFSPHAAERPHPDELLRLLHVPDPLAAGAEAVDVLEPFRARYDAQLARKRALTGERRPVGAPAAETPGVPVRDARPPSRPSLFTRIIRGVAPRSSSPRRPATGCARTACSPSSSTNASSSPSTPRATASRSTSAPSAAPPTARTPCGRRTTCARTPWTATRGTNCPCPTSSTASRSPSRSSAAPRSARPTSSPPCWARSNSAASNRTD
ncbi:hypothetical protein [Streptomyces sp. adm13(2018)]|uniref:hypothetical protein n=1 Tax=Streptomyces sp. adm13(2018) TaxID=2479007 RepID=UPI0011CE252B|nr:hypothetical protein [Streptomyces sp. adm13(2018)]